MAAFVDSQGKPLDGSKNYRFRLPPNVPVKNLINACPKRSSRLFDSNKDAVLALGGEVSANCSKCPHRRARKNYWHLWRKNQESGNRLEAGA
jgi:hypothetical protein